MRRHCLVALLCVTAACSAPSETDGGGGGGGTAGGAGGGTIGGGAGGGTAGGGAGGGGEVWTDGGSWDVVIAGAGTGGLGAAIQASRLGARVLLLEETDWVGGQALAAAVTSMDESAAAERSSGIYGELIDQVRAHYAGAGKTIGTCYWSSGSAAFEPRVGRQVVAQLLAAAGDGGVTVLTGARVARVFRQGPLVTGVGLDDGRAFAARVVVDATEYGDLLPLAGVPYRAGNATSAAPDAGACVQDITYLAVIRKYAAGVPAGFALPPGLKPPGYDDQAPGFATVVVRDGGPWSADGGAWGPGPIPYPVDFVVHNAYRGMPDSTAAGSPSAGTRASAAQLTRTGVNWANDFASSAPADAGRGRLPVAFLEDRAFRQAAICEAKLRTLQFLYYLQNELNEPQWSIADDEGYAASFDGGCPQIPAAFKAIEQHFPPIPYVRESRRMIGVSTLTGADLRGRGVAGMTAKPFRSSVAVAGYGNDLHNCNTDETLESQFETRADISSGLFQVPLEVLLPEAVDGFLAAEKNISQSRLTNGATRLQPSTMLIGQAVGTLAALAVQRQVQPRAVPVERVQDVLLKTNAPISLLRYTDVPRGDPRWGDVEFTATHQVLVGYGNGLFGPADVLTRAQAAAAVVNLFALPVNPPATASFDDVPTTHPLFRMVEALKAAGYTSGCSASPPLFCPDAPLLRVQLAAFLAKGLALNQANPPTTASFTDVPVGAPFFAQVEALKAAGVLGACSAGPSQFCPSASVTRGEVATATRATLLYGK